MQLRHRAGLRVARGLRVEGVGGVREHEARGLQAGGHVRDAVAQGVVVDEGAAEGLAVLQVGHRAAERELRAAQGAGRDVDAAAVEAAHGHGEALAQALLAADEAVGRDAHAVEHDLRRRLVAPAHLLLVRAEGQARGALVHQERGDALGALGAGAGHDQVDVGGAGAGDELLHPVEHPLVAVLDRAGRQVGGVGAGVGLGEAVGAHDLHRGQPRDELGALLLGAELVDHPRDHVVDGQEGRGDRAAAGDAVEHHDAVGSGQAGASVVLGAVQRADAELGEAAHLVDGEMVVRVPLGGVGRDVLGHVRVDGVGEHLLVFGDPGHGGGFPALPVVPAGCFWRWWCRGGVTRPGPAC